MRKLFLILMLVIPVSGWCQENQITQDPDAEAILNRVSQKIKVMKSIQADYSLVIEDRIENTKNTTAGNLQVKHNMYKITGEGSEVYFNGKWMWTYLSANNEVTITEPDNEGDDFLSNPASIFTFYNTDFKYRLVRETTINGSKCYEIDLYPKNLNQPYSRIKLFIGVKTDMPEVISTIGKEGIDYNVYLKNFVIDNPITDAVFTFDPLKHKKVEVVDMRGVK
jgi:outer membrane lipoprotein carrier protein